MRIDIQAETDPQRGPSGPKAIFTSRPTKLRLMSLFAALVLVLIAMKEAKKPERWAWLGLGETPSGNGPVETAPMAQQTTPMEGSQDPAGAIDSESDETRRQKNDVSFIDRFWENSYRNLSLTQKKKLNQVLRQGLKQGSASQKMDPEFKQLIEKIERFGNNFQADLLGEISLLGPESKHKMILSQQLVAFQDHWRKFKTAAIDGIQGTPLEAEQLETLGAVRATLDQTTYEMVRDRTPVVRSADGPAWLRTWERIQVGEPDAEMEDPDSLISHIQLLSQPESYRGRWVEISGTIRGANKIEVRQNELGFDHYYVLWIQPADTDVSPYCVYCLDLPTALSQVGKQFTALSETVRVKGIFFKLRSYETTEREMAICPLILANTCELIPLKKIVTPSVWRPPVWMLVTFLVVMPLVAVCIAIGVYQMTKTSQYTISAKSEKQLVEDLGDLTQNRSIKSDGQRVEELYENSRLHEDPHAHVDPNSSKQRERHD